MMWLGTAFLLGVIVTVVCWTMRTGSHQRAARLFRREDFPSDKIYSEFFEKKHLPRDLVVELWNEVARSLGVPPGKLRPTDRFDKELAPVEEWDDDIVEIQLAAKRRLKQNKTKADLSQIKTVGDYVEFFCNLGAQKPPM
jgi:hypothetical protein